MSEINGIIAEARTKEPFPIGSHEGEYFDRGYRGSAAQQAFNQRVGELQDRQDAEAQGPAASMTRGYRLAWNGKKIPIADAIHTSLPSQQYHNVQHNHPTLEFHQ